MSEKIELNEVRDLSNRINITFSFVKQNGKSIAKNLLYFVPVFLIIGIAMGVFMSTTYSKFMNISASGRFDSNIIDELIPIYIVIILIAIAVSFISLAALLFVVSYVIEYEKSEDGLVDTSLVWNRVKGAFWGTFFGAILAGLLMGVGFMFCFLPGIWLAVSFSLFVPAYVFGKDSELGASITDSLGESFRLIKQDWFGSFGFLFIISIIVMAISFAISLPVSIVQQLTLTLYASPAILGVLFAVSYAISYVGSLFISAIVYVAVTVLFFDLRERREGSSIQKKIDSIGTENGL